MFHKQILAPLAAAVAALFATSASAVDFHGYVRSGTGWSDKKGGQTCLHLPGAQGNGNFRLGNECETYGEMQFDQNLYDGKDGVKFDYHIMLGYAAPNGQDFENLAADGNHIALRQNFGEVKNLPFLNGGILWVGKRYYQRHDVHITDFFYWNDSGPGAGVEKIKLGMGDTTASFAVFRSNGYNQAADPNNNATTRLDARVADINLGGAGSLEVGLQYNSADTKAANSKSGAAVSVEWSMPLLGGVNKLFATSGSGSANAPNLSSPNNVPGSQDGSWGIQDSLFWQITPDFSGMAVAGHWDFKNNYKWDYLGARPVWHFTDYFKLQFEVGANQIKVDGEDGARKLGKATIAPTIVAGRGFWARPELRLYYTYNKWNTPARDRWGGVAGGAAGPWGDSTNGSTYGVQFEAWW